MTRLDELETLVQAQSQQIEKLLQDYQKMQHYAYWLEEQLKLNKQRLYGRSSEATDASQLALFDEAERLIKIFLDYVQQLKESSFSFLNTLGKTLWLWRDEIVRMWRFTKNNGITEGFHRKMKLIQRRAYGFRNFENYRIRVKVLCA